MAEDDHKTFEQTTGEVGSGRGEGTFMTGMKRNLKLETFTMTFREVDTQQV